MFKLKAIGCSTAAVVVVLTTFLYTLSYAANIDDLVKLPKGWLCSDFSRVLHFVYLLTKQSNVHYL